MLYQAAVLSLLALIALPVVAEESSLQREIEVLRTYCRPDIERLCPAVEPGGGRIKECLKQHEKEMSVGCAQALQKLKKK
jgi:hypothetical protein